MPSLKKLRRTLADWIIGDDTVLFTNGRTHELLKSSQFLDASDESVGKMFKHFWAVTSAYRDNEANQKKLKFDHCMISGSVLFLASAAAKANAESADFTVYGSIDGGKTEGAWAVRIESDPDYEANGKESVEMTRDPHDPEKITRMCVTTLNPEYDNWKAKRLARSKVTDT